MHILIMDSDTIMELIDRIIKDNQDMVDDIPLTMPNGQLIQQSFVAKVLEKTMMICAGRADEISDFTGIKPAYIKMLKSDRKLSWLKDLNWYEILVDMADNGLLVKVHS